jgi:hypothetical protein
MTCHDARELFSALLDEKLTREERADVYGHLATCPECRRELTAIERTIALVRGASPVRAPVGFVDRVVRAARPTPWYTRTARALLLPWPVKLPLGAAAVVLIAGLAVLMFRGSEEQQQAVRYEQAPSPLADRRVTEAPAEPPAAPATPADPPAATPPAGPTTTQPAAPPAKAPSTPSPEAASSDRLAATREQDRTAAVASRVDQENKRAETEKRDAAPEQTPDGARAPAPAAQSAPPAATEMFAKREEARAKAATAPQVIARLAAPDRDTAERALAALAARLGGAVAARRIQANTSVIDLTIPRERYSDFMREAARLGVLRIESEPPDGSDTVRITVHLAS